MKVRPFSGHRHRRGKASPQGVPGRSTGPGKDTLVDREEGLEAVLSRKRRATPAVAPIFDGEKEAKLIALAGSKPPKGRARWTLRLLENKAFNFETHSVIRHGISFGVRPWEWTDWAVELTPCWASGGWKP